MSQVRILPSPLRPACERGSEGSTAASGPDASEQTIVNVFRGAVKDSFAFLTEGGRFERRETESAPAGMARQIAFVGEHVAIELHLDLRDEWYECKIALVRSGRVPESFAVNDEGRSVREHLSAIVKRRGAGPADFAKVGGLPFAGKVQTMVANDADLIRRFGRDIIDDEILTLGG